MVIKYEFIGKAIYFPKEKIVAISDLHIGYEDSLSSQGIFIPRRQFEETMKDLKQTFTKTSKVNEVVIVGDLKHEFGTITSQEWRETRKVLDFLREKVGRVILVKGNHDKILEPIAEREEMEIKDHHTTGSICFVHGDRLVIECLDKDVKIIVAGHRHPAIVLGDKYKTERYKCFLVGKYKKKQVVILPSFFPFIEGSEISNIENNKMFISEKKLKDFEVFVVGDEVYKFGKIKEII